MSLRIAEDGEYGIYLWQFPDGKFFGNGQGDFLSIPARKGDLKAMTDIYHAAKHYGRPDGKAVFIPNARQVSKSEQEDQMERLMDGKTPDPYDVGALRDELEAAKQNG